MTRSKTLLFTCVALLAALPAAATSFIVPTDEELVAKSSVIVIGTVEGSYVQQTGDTIETIYEIRVQRRLKGAARIDQLISVASPGGFIEGIGGVHVPSSAHFRHGERVLLFLDRDAKGRFTTTDLTLGKFRFVTSTASERLLVRDMEDVVGWDHAGRVHREKVRREEAFLRFIEDRVAGRPAAHHDYIVDASEVTLAPEEERFESATSAAGYPAATYTSWVANQPTRWPNPTGSFYKRSDQNISGAADGGVSAIQNGLGAWNNECGSVIAFGYAGQNPTPSANHDGVNVVEYNDPQQRVSGSWGGSGTIAITFLSFAGAHTFDGQSWWNITDADVVFQDGYPATNAAFASAMTHELGHALGWRHSNQNHQTGGACNTSVEECTSAAIMNSSVSASYGYTLQPWDVNAAQSVYPGGSCAPTCTPPSITSQPASTTITPGRSVTLSVGATGTSLTYQWYAGSSGQTGSPIAGATGPSIVVTPSATTSYWVRVQNSCGTVNSATATVTVSSSPPPPSGGGESVMQHVVRLRGGDYDGDGRTDRAVYRPSTGTWYINFASGGTREVAFGSSTDIPVPGDYDGDGRNDIAVFRPSTGVWSFIQSSGVARGPTQWGASGDIPVPVDFDGDGRDNIAVWRPSQGTWYIINANGTTRAVAWGIRTDIPTPADYNGDGIDDIAVWRPSDGYWHIYFGPNNIRSVQWGAPGDVPVPADFDGDSIADVVIYRPSQGMWYFRLSSGAGRASQQWGASTDIPVPGDFDGDRRADVAVFRPSGGTWYVLPSSAPGTSQAFQWGTAGDRPLTQ